MFAVRLALRELRSSYRRLAFFFLCLSLGVGSVIALRSMVQNLRELLTSESKSFLASDLLLRSSRPWTDEALALMEDYEASGRLSQGVDSIETTTMARAIRDSPDGSLVELRAVGDGFPIYGRMELGDALRFEHSLLQNFGALVRPELLTRLGLRVGDRLWIGEQDFTIRGTIVNEAGRSMRMFALGPRVLIDYSAIEATGILSYGSRLQYQRLWRVEEQDLAAVQEELSAALADEFIRVRSYRDAGDQLNRRLSRGENYLSLAGFVVLLLGGVGIWSVIRVFVHERRKTVAILKCLGARGREIVVAYVVQVLILALGGSIFGILLARLMMAGLSYWLGRMSLGIDLDLISVGLTSSAVVQGLSIGLTVATVFSLSPLLGLRRVRPRLLLQPEPGGAGPASGWRARLERMDRWDWTAALLGAAALFGLVLWQAGSLQMAVRLGGGFLGVGVALVAVASLLTRSLVPLARDARFAVRHAVLKLTRGSQQSLMVLLAVGLGCFLVLTVRHIQEGILAQFAIELGDDAADMFFLDVQADQVDAIRESAERLGAQQVKLVPVLRARIVSVDGARVRLSSYEEVRERGSLGREYTITYRDHLEDNETVVEGDFWGESAEDDSLLTDDRGEPVAEVSIEDSLQRRFDISIGDTMTFDIMGRSIPARVTSLRDVNWDESRNGGFMFVFRPSGLEGVPSSYAGFIKAPVDEADRASFQREIVGGFPNVSIIDLRDILRALAELVDKISVAISIVGYMSMVSGLLILIGSVAMTRYQRRYETAVFRTLGASRRKLTRMMWIEYGTLGLLAGLVGSIGALATAWALSAQVLEVPFRVSPLESVVAIAAAVVVVSLVGFSLTREVVRHKPLEILRAG